MLVWTQAKLATVVGQLKLTHYQASQAQGFPARSRLPWQAG
jgi:hypothetical protein